MTILNLLFSQFSHLAYRTFFILRERLVYGLSHRGTAHTHLTHYHTYLHHTYHSLYLSLGVTPKTPFFLLI